MIRNDETERLSQCSDNTVLKNVFLDSWGGFSRNMHVMAQVSAPSLRVPQVEERINLLL